MLMKCYKCNLNLCTIYVGCDGKATINLNYQASSAGEYVIYLKFLTITISFSKTIEAGENIEFELPDLNENYCYSFNIKVNKDDFFVNIGGKSYNNFTFCTRKEWRIS